MSEVRHTYYLTNLESRVEPGTEGVLPKSILDKREWVLVPNVDQHHTWGSFSLRQEDTLILPDKGYARVVVQGRRSPTVQFQYGEGTQFPEYFCIVMCGALCRHEVVGRTAERMVYDLFWQGLVTNSPLRDWVKEYCPGFWGQVEDHLASLTQHLKETP